MADIKDIIIKDDSAERVAFDLMEKISVHENVDKKDRIYFLTLYHQCYQATRGREVKIDS